MTWVRWDQTQLERTRNPEITMGVETEQTIRMKARDSVLDSAIQPLKGGGRMADCAPLEARTLGHSPGPSRSPPSKTSPEITHRLQEQDRQHQPNARRPRRHLREALGRRSRSSPKIQHNRSSSVATVSMGRTATGDRSKSAPSLHPAEERRRASPAGSLSLLTIRGASVSAGSSSTSSGV